MFGGISFEDGGKDHGPRNWGGLYKLEKAREGNPLQDPLEGTQPCGYLFKIKCVLQVTYRGFPGGTIGKEAACQCRSCVRLGSIPRLGRSPGGGHGNPLLESCPENLAWRTPWTAEPGMLRSTVSQRARQDWSDLAHRHAPLTYSIVLV